MGRATSKVNEAKSTMKQPLDKPTRDPDNNKEEWVLLQKDYSSLITINYK